MIEKSTKIGLTPKKKQYSAPALEKGLDILELLSAEIEGLNISEITGKLNRSIGEIFRMLVVLEQRGYVEVFAGSDRYRLTLKMFNLSNQFPPIKRLTAVAVPIMEKLSQAIRQSCHLVIYYEGKGQVIVQQDSPSERVFSVRLGAEVPLVNTSSGHLLLAFSSKDQYSTMVQSIPKGHPKPVHDNFSEIIEKVYKQKFECIQSAQTRGVHDICFPVFDYTGNISAALAVPFLEYFDGRHVVEIDNAQSIIQASAEAISKRLGYKED